MPALGFFFLRFLTAAARSVAAGAALNSMRSMASTPRVLCGVPAPGRAPPLLVLPTPRNASRLASPPLPRTALPPSRATPAGGVQQHSKMQSTMQYGATLLCPSCCMSHCGRKAAPPMRTAGERMHRAHASDHDTWWRHAPPPHQAACQTCC
jgi:hypothetical protein